MWIILARTTAETICEVVIVLVGFSRRFGVNTTLGISLGIDSKCTWSCLRKTRGATVANKIALVE